MVLKDRMANPDTKHIYMESFRSLMKRNLARTGLWPFASGRRASVSKLDVREAYRLWAPTYAAEQTVTSCLDEELARQMVCGLPHTRLLDAGCGIGQRIADIPGAMGIDASPDLLVVDPQFVTSMSVV